MIIYSPFERSRRILTLFVVFLLLSDMYWKTPLLVPGVDHFSTANQNNWEYSVTKNKTVFESSFFSLLNAFLALSSSKLYLIEISLRKNVHPRY